MAEGAVVFATDLDVSKMQGLDGCTTRALDVRSTPAVDALAREIGPIDVLFNCAGYGPPRQRPRLFGGGLGLLLRPQCQVDAPDHQGVPARHAGEGQGLDRQHRLGRLVGSRHPQPLCIRGQQGRRDRPLQSGRGRTSSSAAFAATPSAPGPSKARPSKTGSTHWPETPTRAGTRCNRALSTASRWAGSARPMRSRCWPSIWRPTSRATPPGRSTWRTAASPSDLSSPVQRNGGSSKLRSLRECSPARSLRKTSRAASPISRCSPTARS